MAEGIDIFGKALRSHMKRAGMTKTELHRKTGIARPSIDLYFNGASAPQMDTLRKIAAALNIEPWMLLVDPDNPPQSLELKDHDIEECYRRLGEALKGLKKK